MDVVSIPEAARRLRISTDAVRSRIRRGELKVQQVSTPESVGMGVVMPDQPPEETGQVGEGISKLMGTIGLETREAYRPQVPQVMEAPNPFPEQYSQDIGRSTEQSGWIPSAVPPESPETFPPQENGTPSPVADTNPGEMGHPVRQNPESSMGFSPESQPISSPRVNGAGVALLDEPPHANGNSQQHPETNQGNGTMVVSPGTDHPHAQLVAALRDEVEAQREELKARRQEIHELHLLLEQLMARSLSQTNYSKGRWWQGLFRRS